jgi:competence protein ComGC
MKTTNGFTLIEVLGGFSIILGILFLIILPLFLAIDWRTGEHGRLTITAVDKNLFGTYTVYARNSESMSGNEMSEVTYCIDSNDVEVAQKAKDSIGKQNTTLVYPEGRFGLYGLSKCSSAPIKDIVIAEIIK